MDTEGKVTCISCLGSGCWYTGNGYKQECGPCNGTGFVSKEKARTLCLVCGIYRAEPGQDICECCSDPSIPF